MTNAPGEEPRTPAPPPHHSLARVALVAYLTIARREVRRFLRIWVQTLLPPVITMSLYLLIFGNLIGRRIGEMSGVPYIDFIAPGIIMMAVITSAYANVSSSFFGARIQKYVEEILVSPAPAWALLLGYVTGGAARGLAVGLIVTVTASVLAELPVYSPLLTALVAVFTAVFFSLLGFLNALFARTFDDVSIVPTFILAPLTYLGGVFYSVSLLPEPWSTISLFNPILYMVNAFRFGILGVSDIAVFPAMLVLGLGIAALFTWALWLLGRGVGIRQ